MERKNRLVQKLPQGVRAALIHSPANMRYLSGYTGEGLLVLAENLAAIVTDFRYVEQAQRESPGFEVLQTSPESLHNKVALAALERIGAKSVALEENGITYAEYKALVQDMPGVGFSSLEGLVEEMRKIKDPREADALARANQLTSDAFEYIVTYVRPGMTERHLALELERYMMEHGAESLAFDTIVASGENGSLPHATPGARQVREGDLVTFDFGARVDGYCADMTRTIAIGEVSQQLHAIYDVVQTAQQMALDAVKPGMACSEVDKIARDFIYGKGYEGKFGHGLGHATGLQIHENPRCNTVSTDILQEGMTMTIEPGIYLPGIGGVRIEDSVLVTRNGYRRLTPATKDLITIKA